jgi:hypothetical protein
MQSVPNTTKVVNSNILPFVVVVLDEGKIGGMKEL